MGVALWVCVRLCGYIVQLPSMWSVQMSQWAGGTWQNTPREDRCTVHQVLHNTRTSRPAIRTRVLDSLQHPVWSHHASTTTCALMAVPWGGGWSCQCCAWHYFVRDYRVWLLVISCSDLMAQCYISDILCPLLGQHPDTVCQQDNTSPLMARVYGLPAPCWGPPVASQVPRSFPNWTCVESARMSTQNQCQSTESQGPVTTAVGRLAAGEERGCLTPFHTVSPHVSKPGGCHSSVPIPSTLLSIWPDIIIIKIQSHDLSPCGVHSSGRALIFSDRLLRQQSRSRVNQLFDDFQHRNTDVQH